MINKKMINIKVIAEFGELEHDYGIFGQNDIQKLVDIAVKENMSCLSFISLDQDMYFNEIQCKDIKKELDVLRKKEKNNVKKDLLDTIEKASDLAIENWSFVKFEIAEL